MKIKQLGAMALGSLMVLSTVGFAATLADYPQPFIDTSGADNFLVVVGNTAAPSDVVGAIDVAARLGGETGSDVSVSGGVELSVSGEGKQSWTTNTKVFDDDALGKTGLRTTMTKDDLPTTLATGSFSDSDGSLTTNYQQFIYLTPGDNTCTAGGSENYCMQFERPSSTATMDPTYSFGRFPTSPTTSDYFYRTYVTFDKNVNAQVTAIGETITLFGKKYTIHSDTTMTGSPAKFVISGGASETLLLQGGETTVVTIDGTQYEVTYIASSDSDTGIIRVGTDQKNIDSGKSARVGGLDVFMDAVFDVSSTDPTLDSAKVLLGAEKLILQDGSKVKTGTNEDSVDGTYVNLTISSGNLSGFYVYIGARSSTDDYLQVGGEYVDPVWKSFKIRFDSITPEMTDTNNRDMIKISPSGDNLMQITMTDDRGYEKTLNWAYKSSSTGANFTLADNAGNVIHAQEINSGTTPWLNRDQYITLDAGDFTHFFKLSGMSVDATSSSNLELTDQFSGVTTKVTLGTDNADTKIIDGQTYYITANSTATSITWGTGAAANSSGLYHTVYPMIKTKKGAHIAFYTPEVSVPNVRPAAGGFLINLPTGSINITTKTSNGGEHRVNITAVSKEDGTASAMSSVTGNTTSTTIVQDWNMSTSSNYVAFSLGRTSTGGLQYYLKALNNETLNISIANTAAAQERQPGVIIIEEKDDSSNVYSAYVVAATEASGSNSVAIPYIASTSFTSPATGTSGVSLGTDSTLTDYVDLYGLYARKTTSGQDTLTFYYPDDQTVANVFVLGEDATVTTGGGSGGTVHSSTPIKNAIAKLDTEVTSADQTTKNVILVGGPAVNTLVANLATAGKTKNRDYYVEQGAGYALLDLVADAFATGKSALVVAGHSAADTRTVTGFLQKFEDHASQFAGKNMVEYKNGVLQTTTA